MGLSLKMKFWQATGWLGKAFFSVDFLRLLGLLFAIAFRAVHSGRKRTSSVLEREMTGSCDNWTNENRGRENNARKWKESGRGNANL